MHINTDLNDEPKQCWQIIANMGGRCVRAATTISSFPHAFYSYVQTAKRNYLNRVNSVPALAINGKGLGVSNISNYFRAHKMVIHTMMLQYVLDNSLNKLIAISVIMYLVIAALLILYVFDSLPILGFALLGLCFCYLWKFCHWILSVKLMHDEILRQHPDFECKVEVKDLYPQLYFNGEIVKRKNYRTSTNTRTKDPLNLAQLFLLSKYMTFSMHKSFRPKYQNFKLERQQDDILLLWEKTTNT